MLVILLNCVTLGMFHPCEDIDCDSERCKILEVRLPVTLFAHILEREIKVQVDRSTSVQNYFKDSRDMFLKI